MNPEKTDSFPSSPLVFEPKVQIRLNVGRFSIKTITSPEELKTAFKLRYQVFQVEMIGLPLLAGEDHDEYDQASDHLAIYDQKTNQMIATCRLNSSLFSSRFYSEQEFECASLIALPGTKLEIGRVCVHQDFRKGIVIMLLWRAIAEYMKKIEARYLFGCGSVATEDPNEAFILYRSLKEEGKMRPSFAIAPSENFRSNEFDQLLFGPQPALLSDERVLSEKLLPSLCRSYFDIGCFAAGPPAFDREFKCIDFLTVLDTTELSPQIRRKLLGDS